MGFDFNDKAQREAVHTFVHETVKQMKKRGQIGATIHIDSMDMIDQLIEYLENVVEDQEERIAIMTEGGPG